MSTAKESPAFLKVLEEAEEKAAQLGHVLADRGWFTCCKRLICKECGAELRVCSDHIGVMLVQNAVMYSCS